MLLKDCLFPHDQFQESVINSFLSAEDKTFSHPGVDAKEY